MMLLLFFKINTARSDDTKITGAYHTSKHSLYLTVNFEEFG